MNVDDPEILRFLRSPGTGKNFRVLDNAGNSVPIRGRENAQQLDDVAFLVTEDGAERYPIVRGIPRFVSDENYADNFGYQWNRFRKTQLDSLSGRPISSSRFWKSTGWSPESLRGQWVLDVGCGAGRFTELALAAGANVVALDYSAAVDACAINMNSHPNLFVIQADIYRLPLALESFSFVYCLGVLQHTPNVAAAFRCLPAIVSPGGHICVDYYEKSVKTLFNTKYWVRPFFANLAPQQTLEFVERALPMLFGLSRFLRRIPLVGYLLSRLIPVSNYEGILDLNSDELYEWALLDTFDAIGAKYDSPQSAKVARQLMVAAGLEQIEILRVGHLVARGIKPARPAGELSEDA